jgi:hypothetical protein
VRLIAHPPSGIEADRPRAQEDPEVGGQVARGPIVAGHHERRPLGLGVEEARKEVGAHARGHEGALRLAPRRLAQSGDLGGLVSVCEELSQRHGHVKRPPGHPARL